ncbi:unnamed protein product, partial [Ectocarpus sp. 12 AP-2014]
DIFEKDIVIKFSDLNDWELRTYRFYGGGRDEYNGVREFWWSEITLKALRGALLGSISQSVFNTMFRFRSDRMEVLRKIVELDIEDAKKGTSIIHISKPKSTIQLQSEFFGNRIYGHPAYSEISARFRLVIESLAASGDLNSGKAHEYSLSGKALATLSEYELDERRHAD